MADSAAKPERAAPDSEMSGSANDARPARRHLLSRIPEEAGVFVALIVLIAAIGIVNPNFLSVRSLVQLFSNAAITGILALAMVLVIVIREIDLSIGWSFNFSAVIAGNLMVWGIDPFLAAGAGVLFGGFLGAVNGILAVGLGLPVIIITLGTLSMFRGLSLIANNSRAVVPPNQESIFFTMWGHKFFGVVPSIAVAFIMLAIVTHVILQHTRFGFRAQALGSNPAAARLSGIPVARTQFMVLVLMGIFSGLAGALFLGFRGAIDPTSGDAFLLPVIAAVIIGGTPLSGGRGSVFGAVLGALIIQVIQSGMLFLGIDARWSIFMTGAVIVIAVAIDQIVRKQRAKHAGDTVDLG